MALKEYFNETPNAAVTMVSSSRWCAQSWTTTSSYDIASVKVRLYRSGTPGTVTVSIRAASGDAPTGGDLASGTTDGDTLTTDTAGEWREVTFGSSYTLSSGIKYTIVVRAEAGILGWTGRDGAPLYADGDNSFSFNSGENWSSHAGVEDHNFETYSGAPPEKPINPTPSDEAATVTLDQATLAWEDGGGADTFDVYFGPTGSMTLQSSAQAGVSWDVDILPFPYATTYQWRIDATNEEGTTTGDTWSFTTITFSPPSTAAGKWRILKRLVAAAADTFWYEDI